MEMTKQRKMLIGVLCLGLGGLAVDRFVIGAPESASASQEPETIVVDQAPPPLQRDSAEPPQQAVGNDAVKSLPSYASLTERLLLAQQQGEAESSEHRDDPFAVPEQWQAQRPSGPKELQEGAGTHKHVKINSLFKLDGTVRSQIDGREELLAVISGGGLDGRAIRVGQKIRVPRPNEGHDEYQLVEVGPRYVVWQVVGTDQRVEMRVESDL